MEKIKNARLLFEQSGTFKKEFEKLGIKAYDYDILNDFDNTDYQIDLFKNIDAAYGNKPSIFDSFNKEDCIMAFFPCTRFEDQSIMLLNGNHNSVIKQSEQYKLEYSMKRHEELHQLYIYICKLCLIVLDRGFRMIVENPYSVQHYLTRYFPLKSIIIDKDRRERGDYFKKPTQYWFVNCKPEDNLIFEVTNNNSINISIEKMSDQKAMGIFGIKDRKIARSMINPEYANRFIREYILKEV